MAPSVRAFLRNLRVPMPWRLRSKLAALNNIRKVTRARWCCGNTGQPGC